MANGQLNGTDLKVFVAGTLVAYSTNCSININHSLRSTSSKESGGWDENMEGMRNWDLSCDALYAWLQPDGTAITGLTLSELFTTYMATRTSFTVTFGVTTSATEDTKYTGTAWITSLSLTAPLEDTSTYSVSMTGSGALTQTIA
jgi:predicted secreted protein